MKCVRAVLLVLLFSAPAVTQAAPVLPGAPESLPFLFVCANDLCLPFAVPRLPDGKTFGFENFPIFFPGVAQLEIDAVYNPDPFITFGATTTNLVPGTTTFAFLFGTPVVPGVYNHATSTGGVSVTNGLSGTTTVDNSGIFPSYISGYGTLSLLPTNLGVDLGTAPCIAGPGSPFALTTTCAQGTVSNFFAPTFYDNLEALLTYTQNDSLSVASWSGAVTLGFERTPPVPEPALLGLVGVAIVGLRMRRRLT